MPNEPAQLSRRSPLGAAKLIAVCTLVSRITGLLRDMLLLHVFGQSWIADAFNFAFQFPNLFRRLFGEGALAAVFVPTFTRTLETDGRPAAWRLLARTLALLTVVLSALIILIELVLLGVWFYASSAATGPELAARSLYLGLTALMLPFMLSICILALFSSILNCVGSFVPAALAPIVLNIFMIIAIGWLAPALAADDMRRQVYIVALAVIAAGVVQIVTLWPALRSAGVPIGWAWEPRDATVRGMLGMMGPVLLGQGVLLISTFLDTLLCTLLTARAQWLGPAFPYPLQEGALTAVSSAARLYQFPLGVLVISLATASLPAFSRMAVRNDWPAWSIDVRRMLRLAIFEGLVAGAMMIVLALPIVRLLFEYRNFTAADSGRAAHVLAWYGAGMWAFCAQHIVTRAFYSIGDVRTPLRITCWFVPVNLAISLGLVWLPDVREAAFAISSAVTSSLSMIVGLAALRRRTESPLIDASLLRGLGMMLVSAGAAAATVYIARLAWRGPLESLDIGEIATRSIDTLGSLGLGVAAYLCIAAALRLPEPAALLRHSQRNGPRDP